MNNKVSKKIAVFAALFAMVVAFSSCNRGYGCPYELKSNIKTILPVIK